MAKAKEPTYTPTEDVVEQLTDGSGSKVVAKAGVAIPWARALALGLVKGDPPEPKDAPVTTTTRRDDESTTPRRTESSDRG